MKLKKIAITISSTLAASSPLIMLASINTFPKGVDEGTKTRYIILDDITMQRKADLKKALDNTIGDSKLKINFYTLTVTNQYTPSKLAWFQEFKKTLNWLDPRLEFELIPRSAQTVQTGYREKNGEIISMFWAPDYNNIGTWLGFWFMDRYQLPNYWIPLYEAIKKDNGATPWMNELKTYLENYKLYENVPSGAEVLFTDSTSEDQTGKITNNFFHSYDELLEFDLKIQGLNIAKNPRFRSDVGDKIGNWADQTDQKNSASLVAWMNEKSVMLPWVCQGPSSVTKRLVRKDFHVPKNDYTDENFRSWFYDGPGDAKDQKFRWWVAGSPFQTNKTPYNASFNEAPNAAYFQSVHNGLTAWKINGDWVFDYQTKSWIPPKGSLCLSGASQIILKDKQGLEVNKIPQSPITSSSTSSDFEIYPANNKAYAGSKEATTYEFIVDPKFEWKNKDGQKQSMLTAQDYFWGFIGYGMSCDFGFNRNGYYMELADLDVEETKKANPDFYDFYDPNLQGSKKYANWNLKPKKNPNVNKFVIKLKIPNSNFLDIVSKQYFQPLPIDNYKTQNIFWERNNILKHLDSTNEELRKSAQNYLKEIDSLLENFYGSGSHYEDFVDWWSVGPYYVSNVSEQDITFKRNDNYFSNFPNDMYTDNSKKIGEVIMKYGGAYSDQLTYVQFKSNEIDLSNIPISELANATSLKGEFRTQGIASLPKHDLLSFNANVLLKNPKNNIEYAKSKSEFGNKNLIEVEDLNGNTRVLKSLVSKEYYYAIVRDYYVPGGNSEKIRKGIVDSIDWYSLAALAVPDDNVNFQQSIIPYGNFPIDPNKFTAEVNDPNIKPKTFYELAQNTKDFGILRRGLWSIKDYKEHWLKKFK